MSEFQVLCATMHQKDFSLVRKMNIGSDAVFANQCDETSYKCENRDGQKLEMISTLSRGSGNNRNISLICATADICLLADDDVTYYPNYKEKIMDAFRSLPDADMIIFNMDTDSANRSLPKIHKNKKMYFWHRNPYGSVRVAFRLSSQKKYNIWFSNIFGAGAIYGSGEDSLFINDFRKKGNVYLCKETIGKVDFSQSSWFTGYDDTFFFNNGAKIAALYKKMGIFMMVYYMFRYKKKTALSCYKMLMLMKAGYKDFNA